MLSRISIVLKYFFFNDNPSLRLMTLEFLILTFKLFYLCVETGLKSLFLNPLEESNAELSDCKDILKE